MQEWLDGLAGPGYAAALAWTLAALLLLVVVLVIIKVVRSLTFGTFVAGGRNRKTRLAVMDATAVDSHRRLVLVRRDDVEHLILIGGPTDVVVEQDIRMHMQQRRAMPEQEPRMQRPRTAEPAPAAGAELRRPAPAAQPQQLPVRPAPQQSQPIRPLSARPAEPQLRAVPPRSAPPAPPAPPAAQPAPAQTQRPAPAAASSPRAHDEIDAALMDELEVKLDKTPAPKSKADMSLEDEMTKLLGELSSGKR